MKMLKIKRKIKAQIGLVRVRRRYKSMLRRSEKL